MATFYKGVAPGTHLHALDLRVSGLGPRNPAMAPSLAGIISHIRRGTTRSPFMSLTKSFGIAMAYAAASRLTPGATKGHVYEIRIDDPAPIGFSILDPVAGIVSFTPSPFSAPWHHNGDENFLLGVVDYARYGHHMLTPAKEPPNSGATPHPPQLSPELEAMMRALRDAEVLAIGNLPSSVFIDRHDV